MGEMGGLFICIIIIIVCGIVIYIIDSKGNNEKTSNDNLQRDIVEGQEKSDLKQIRDDLHFIKNVVLVYVILSIFAGLLILFNM